MIGRLILRRFGMKKAYQKMFEKFLKLGVMGLGYEQPMKSSLLEKLLLKRVLEDVESPIIFDVGANKGQYIDLVKEALSSRAFDVFAFEPDQSNASELDRRFSNQNVRIENFGLSDKNERLKFFKHSQDDLSTIHFSENHPSNYRSKSISQTTEIAVQKIDDYCAERKIERIDFLKIDTEGHELFVLLGAKRMIEKKQIKNIQFEFSEMNIASKTRFFDFWLLLNENYNFFRICVDGNYEIKDYIPLIHEIYHPVNFFACLK